MQSTDYNAILKEWFRFNKSYKYCFGRWVQSLWSVTEQCNNHCSDSVVTRMSM